LIFLAQLRDTPVGHRNEETMSYIHKIPSGFD